MTTRIDLLFSRNCLPGVLLGTIDVLRAANSLWRLRNPRKRTVPFSWRLIDAGGAPLELPPLLADALASTRGAESELPAAQTALVLSGLQMQSVPHLEQLLAAAQPEIDLITARHAAGGLVAASYNGAAMLGRAGVLDGRSATITWLIAGWFSRSFPRTQLLMDRPVTVDGSVLCAGAPAAHTLLALELVRHFAGEELAQTCSNVMLYQPSRFEQSGLMMSTLATKTRDGVVFKAKQWLEQHIDQPYDLDATAQAASVSTRTLLRHFHEVADMSPLDYLHKLRIERAKQLLEVTLFDLPSIIESCGYHDTSAFRRLFRRETGLSPSEYRRRYAVRSERRWWRANETPGSILTG